MRPPSLRVGSSRASVRRTGCRTRPRARQPVREMGARRRNDMNMAFVCAVILRLVLIAWSAYQDANFDAKYTDIDYFVYTDAARHVVRGGSPYERATYRYPPLLAVLLAPNVLVHEMWGKVFFSTLDIAVGGLILKIGRRRGMNARELKYALWCWLFNPFTCAISTRGSCEALTGVLMLLTVEALTAGATTRAAIAYGFVVHMRLYPIIHALMFVAFLNKDYMGNRALFGKRGSKALSWVTVENVKFAVVSSATFFALTAGSYAVYGMDYIDEAILYHAQRKDHRHNFSPAFYGIYLSIHPTTDAPDLNGSAIVQTADRLAMSPLPMLTVVLSLGFAFASDMPFALFVQTLAFVAFNKVCTAQYFVWWFMLLPLVLPSLMRSANRKRVVFATLIWLIAQLHWLAWAYALEFKGAQVFESVWLASIAFFGANIWLLLNIIAAYAHAPIFSRGRLQKFSKVE